MATELKINVNGRPWKVAAAPDTPLLYVLANELQLQGPRFGCGLAQCGSCSVLVNGVETRSCVTPVSAVAGNRSPRSKGCPHGTRRRRNSPQAPALHPDPASHDRRAGRAMRLLLQRHDRQGVRAAVEESAADRSADPHRDERPSVPLRHVSANYQSHSARVEGDVGGEAHDFHAASF